MAKEERLTIRVDAETKAAEKSLDALAKTLNEVEDQKIKVTADTKAAERGVQELSAEFKKLSKGAEIDVELGSSVPKVRDTLEDIVDIFNEIDGKTAKGEVTVDTGTAEADTDKLLTDLKDFDGETYRAELVAEMAKAEADVEQLTAEIKEYDGSRAEATLTVDTSNVEGKVRAAREEIDKVPRSAGGANSALANMIGNSAQDLGAMTGVVGSLGVGIGQMAEYAADARLEGEGLGSVMKNMTGIVGPMLGLSAAIFAAQLAMKAFGDNGRDTEADLEAVNDALTDSIGRLDEFRAAADEAFEAGTADPLEAWNNQLLTMIEGLEDGEEQLDKTSDAVVNLSDLAQGGTLNLTDLADIFATLDENAVGFISSQLQAAGASKEYADALAVSIAAGEGLDDQARNMELSLLAEKESIDLNSESWVARTAALRQLVELQGILQIDEEASQFLDEQAAIDDNTEAMVRNARARQLARDGTADESEALEIYIGLLGEENAAQAESADAAERINRLNQQFVDDVNARIAAQEEANEEQDRLTLSTEELADASLALEDPAEALPGVWAQLVNELGKGAVDLELTKDLVDQLAQATNLAADDIIRLAVAEADLSEEDLAAKMREDAEAAQELAQAMADLQDEIDNIDTDDLANISSDLAAALDVGGIAVNLQVEEAEVRGQIIDAQKAIQDHVDEFGEVNWNVVLNAEASAEGFDAELARQIDTLQNSLQTGIVNAFETGGVPAATAFAESYRTQLIEMGMSPAQVTEFMGIPPGGDIPLFLQLQIDKEARADALAVLEGIKGVSPDDPLLAYLSLAVQTGTIDPVIGEIAAQILAAETLGVPIETVIDPAVTDEQIALARQQIAAAEAATIPTATGAPDTSTTDEALARYDPLTGVLIPVATSEDASVAETGTTLDEFGNPITTQVIVPKSDSLGAMQDLLDHVARARETKFNAKAPDAGTLDKILDAIAEPRTAKYLTSYDTAAAQAKAALDMVANPRTALYHTSYGTAAANADAALDAVAAPRTAPIIVDLRGEEEAARILDLLDNPRTVVIRTRSTGGSSSTGGSGTVGGDTLMAPAAAPMAVGATALAAPAPMSISPVTMALPTPAAVAPVTNNMSVTIQAGVIGNRNEVDRIVSKALRRHVRLNGSRN